MFVSTTKSKFDLADRTTQFGMNIIIFCKKIDRNEITRPLIHQLVKCGTSVGANYCEADNAESRADFIHKIGICKKESSEAQYFLRMMSIASPAIKNEARILWKEARELNLIFNTIFRRSKMPKIRN